MRQPLADSSLGGRLAAYGGRHDGRCPAARRPMRCRFYKDKRWQIVGRSLAGRQLRSLFAPWSPTTCQIIPGILRFIMRSMRDRRGSQACQTRENQGPTDGPVSIISRKPRRPGARAAEGLKAEMGALNWSVNIHELEQVDGRLAHSR